MYKNSQQWDSVPCPGKVSEDSLKLRRHKKISVMIIKFGVLLSMLWLTTHAYFYTHTIGTYVFTWIQTHTHTHITVFSAASHVIGWMYLKDGGTTFLWYVTTQIKKCMMSYPGTLQYEIGILFINLFFECRTYVCNILRFM